MKYLIICTTLLLNMAYVVRDAFNASLQIMNNIYIAP